MTTISYGEYVEPEDIKIKPNTGSETMEELNLEDILETISEIPMDPLPGQDILNQPYVEQDANGDEHQQDTSDDDSADWPALCPLCINLGVPVQPEEHRPRILANREDQVRMRRLGRDESSQSIQQRDRQEGGRHDLDLPSTDLRSDSLRVVQKTVKNGVSAHYYGESARTPFLRGREHLRGQAKGLEENPMAKHDSVHHPDLRGSYSMKVLRRHKAPLGHQVQEAVEIEHSKAQVLLNRKGEFNGARVPRVTIEVGGKILTGNYRGHEPRPPPMTLRLTPMRSPSGSRPSGGDPPW